MSVHTKASRGKIKGAILGLSSYSKSFSIKCLSHHSRNKIGMKYEMVSSLSSLSLCELPITVP